MSVTILIPAYNEESRLPETLDKINKEIGCKVIVVDGESTDNTASTAKEYGATVITNIGDEGKGCGIKKGFEHVDSEYVVICDADLPVLTADIAHLLQICPDYDMVISSRYHQDAQATRSKLRDIVGKTFSWYVRKALSLPYHDTQCGVKAAKLESIKEIIPQINESGFLFDVELLLLAQQKGLHVKEVGVTWTEQAGSKVNVIKDSYKMFLGILKIRSRYQR